MQHVDMPAHAEDQVQASKGSCRTRPIDVRSFRSAIASIPLVARSSSLPVTGPSQKVAYPVVSWPVALILSARSRVKAYQFSREHTDRFAFDVYMARMELPLRVRRDRCACFAGQPQHPPAPPPHPPPSPSPPPHLMFRAEMRPQTSHQTAWWRPGLNRIAER